QVVHVRLGLVEQGALEAADVPVQPGGGPERPEPRVRGRLIVAGPPGVELPGDVADLFVQEPLDEGVDVLILRVLRRTRFDAGGHAAQPLVQGARLVRGQHARPEEPLDPRPAPLDVLAPETVIHRKAAVQLIQRRRGSYTETAAPEPVRRLAGGRLVAGHGLANVALGHLLLRSGQGRHGCAPAPPFSAGARPASSAGSASDSSVAPGDAAPAGSAAESA